jgi:flagellar hook-associated protein 1 FlgK
MSLFENLNVATRGLSAAQLGISVTGQNITNASTEGYSRKRIEQSSEWRKDGSYGQMGFGVEVYCINRMRNQFVDRLVNQESTRHGYFSVKDNAFGRIEDVFQEPTDYGINALLNKFWDGWADVANNPDSAGARETLRSTAQSLTLQFNSIATQLRSYKDTINDEIEARVNRINQLTEGIYRCNVQITGAEGSLNHKANDTRDQRDKMLEELASLIDVDYFEDEHGALMLSSGGNMLVSLAKNHELMMTRTKVVEEDGYQYSRVDISHSLTGKEFKPNGGELRALMEVRDVDIPKYENYTNELAKSLITEVNKIHQNGYALSGLTFIDFFDSDPKNFNAANMRVSQAVKNDVNNIAAGIGGTIQNANIEYTPILYADAMGIPLTDPPSSVPLDLTTIDDRYRYLQKNSFKIEVVDTTFVPPITRELQEGKDYVIDYTNARITFMDNATSRILQDPNDPMNPDYPMQILISFKHTATAFGGPGDGDNALALSQLRDSTLMQSDVFGKPTQTINQFYAGMLGHLGVERNEAANGYDTRVNALLQLKGRQDEIMGVSLDEEMASLIQYEYTYQASARFLQTVNTMLETLLNIV